MVLTENELVQWGVRIGSEVSGPLFLGLKGSLGAGKSVLARAVARGAGVRGPMPSPTFNLLFEYPSSRGFSLVHVDLYRIEGPEELWELGWGELGSGSEVVLVEWPEKAGDLLPDDRWEIELIPPIPASLVREVVVSRFGHPHHLPGFPVSVDSVEVEGDGTGGEVRD